MRHNKNYYQPICKGSTPYSYLSNWLKTTVSEWLSCWSQSDSIDTFYKPIHAIKEGLLHSIYLRAI